MLYRRYVTFSGRILWWCAAVLHQQVFAQNHRGVAPMVGLDHQRMLSPSSMILSHVRLVASAPLSGIAPDVITWNHSDILVNEHCLGTIGAASPYLNIPSPLHCSFSGRILDISSTNALSSRFLESCSKIVLLQRKAIELQREKVNSDSTMRWLALQAVWDRNWAPDSHFEYSVNFRKTTYSDSSDMHHFHVKLEIL